MKIIHLTHSLDIGGMESLVIALASCQAGLGHEVILCSLSARSEKASPVSDSRLRQVFLHKKPGKDIGLVWRLFRLLATEKPDILHTHNITGLIYGGIAGALARVRRIVNTRHGESDIHCNRYIWRTHHAIAAVSRSARKKLLANNSISVDKVRIIHNGITPPAASQATGETRPDELVIGTVSRLIYYKDPRALIEAFTLVSSRVPAAQLWIIGDGPMKNELESFARAQGIGARVIFWGWRNDVPALLERMRIFALSSLTEGLSIAVLEAMALGVPVVATNVGGNPEVIADEETGLLVPAKDPAALARALVRLLTNPGQARVFGQAGQQRVRELFSLPVMAQAYESLYRELGDTR